MVASKELEDAFTKVTRLIRETPVTKELETVSTDDRLRLYGLYKHSTFGPCNREPPSILAVESYAKHRAWCACTEMTRESAMLEYLEMASSQPHWLGRHCRSILDAYKETAAPGGHAQNAGVDTMNVGRKVESEVKASRLRQWLGFGRMEPRGQLDISYQDLWFAMRQCLFSSGSLVHYRRHEETVRHEWRSATGREAMVSLSARSLLDLYLLAKQYPRGSEIILAPGINVPGMLHVLRHHQLKVVSVDLPQNDEGSTLVGINVEAVAQAVSTKTVAVLVTHPFGIICAGEADMRRLKLLCMNHKLDLLEDCAECYTGLGSDCYLASPHSDLALFSFGLIKTATALGGGVAVASRPELIRAMQRKQTAMYGDQTRFEYLRTVVAVVLFRVLCDVPVLYGLIYFCIIWMGLDFDSVVINCVRGFPVPNHGLREKHSSEEQVDMARIRRRPSAVLVSLLGRRFRSSSSLLPRLKRRAQQCEAFAAITKDCLLSIPDDAMRTHWVFPILSGDNPDLLCEHARRRGYDSTRGASQLVCTGSPSDCPRASALMEAIVYLPIAGQSISRRRLIELGELVQKFQSEKFPKRLSPVASKFSLHRPSHVAVAIFAILSYLPVGRLLEVLASSTYCVVSAISLFLICCIWVQRSMSSFYLTSSNAFSKYNYLMKHQTGATKAEPTQPDSSDLQDTHANILSDMEVLRIPSTSKVRNRKVILTGSTGFIGAALLRDLLFHREKLGLAKVLLICRPKREVSPKRRVEELLGDPMFSFLSDEDKAELVAAIPGDVSEENAGIESTQLEELVNDNNITHIIHAAAAVSFTQSLEDAATSNISSALCMQRLASRLANKSARFVHVSTAFVHGDQTGTWADPLDETLFPLGSFDAMKVFRSMTGTQYYAATAMRDLGFPNTYTFSKCVCEHLLVRSRVDTLIVRPSIVGPSLSAPCEGWAGAKPSTLVAAACLYFAYQFNLWFFGSHLVPCIPVDVLSRFIVRRAFEFIPGKHCQSSVDTSSDEEYEAVNEPEVCSMSSVSTSSPVPSLSAGQTSSPVSICNATWDVCSERNTQFTWVDYAVAVTQLGSVMGDFSRPVALVGLFFTTKLLPRLNLSIRQYELLHSLAVMYPFRIALWFCERVGCDTQRMRRLQSFLDLPLLFFPFMTRDFHFRSTLVAPNALHGDRYLFSCTVAARRFVEQSKIDQERGSRALRKHGLSLHRIAGRLHRTSLTDLTWALTQPIGSTTVRLMAWVTNKILRMSFDEVTVDIESFALLRNSCLQGNRIVLAPTHRSFFDFILLSFTFFSVPELQIDIPFIAAAAEFSQIPLIGWLVVRGRAFFVKRNRGQTDPVLGNNIRAISRECKSPFFEVFIEGRRSRDRRFVVPKTGFLKCIHAEEKEQEVLVVPISISYERIPEQERLVEEACFSKTQPMKLSSLLWWLWVRMLL